MIYGDTFASNADGWSADPGKCFLGSDGYHSVGYLCYAPAGMQADVDVAVTVQQISGPTVEAFGIVFRRVAIGNFYRFMIDSDSKWVFDKCVNDTCTRLVDFTPNNAIKGGLKTVNALEVSAKGSHFDFFVNRTKVGSADDSTFASGEVGVVGGSSSECVFVEIRLSRSHDDFALAITTNCCLRMVRLNTEWCSFPVRGVARRNRQRVVYYTINLILPLWQGRQCGTLSVRAGHAGGCANAPRPTLFSGVEDQDSWN